MEVRMTAFFVSVPFSLCGEIGFENKFGGIRNTYYVCVMKATSQKRNNHSYKCTDTIYADAMKRAKKEKGQLAVHIEHWVKCYSEGLEMKIKYTIKK